MLLRFQTKSYQEYTFYKFFFLYFKIIIIFLYLKLFYDIMFADFERYIFINERKTKSRIIVIGAKNAQIIKCCH